VVLWAYVPPVPVFELKRCEREAGKVRGDFAQGLAGYALGVSGIDKREEEDAQAFMTRGSISLSISLVTTAVGKMRGGFGLNWFAGGHLREKCLTIGLSIETGSPYTPISFWNKLIYMRICNSVTCLINQLMQSLTYNFPSKKSFSAR
jgi:hypothetical protein